MSVAHSPLWQQQTPPCLHWSSNPTVRRPSPSTTKRRSTSTAADTRTRRGQRRKDSTTVLLQLISRELLRKFWKLLGGRQMGCLWFLGTRAVQSRVSYRKSRPAISAAVLHSLLRAPVSGVMPKSAAGQRQIVGAAHLGNPSAAWKPRTRPPSLLHLRHCQPAPR